MLYDSIYMKFENGQNLSCSGRKPIGSRQGWGWGLTVKEHEGSSCSGVKCSTCRGSGYLRVYIFHSSSNCTLKMGIFYYM